MVCLLSVQPLSLGCGFAMCNKSCEQAGRWDESLLENLYANELRGVWSSPCNPTNIWSLYSLELSGPCGHAPQDRKRPARSASEGPWTATCNRIYPFSPTKQLPFRWCRFEFCCTLPTDSVHRGRFRGIWILRDVQQNSPFSSGF